MFFPGIFLTAGFLLISLPAQGISPSQTQKPHAGETVNTSSPCADDRMGQMKSKANSGDPSAQFHLGLLYLNGICAEPDIDEGIGLLEKAAHGNYANAATMLGNLYLDGSVVEEDLDKARDLFLIAAQQGEIEAQHKVGLLFLKYPKSEKSRDTGLDWLGKAVAQKDAFSAVILGLIHKRGLYGVVKDNCLAREWFDIALDIGVPNRESRHHVVSLRQSTIC
ncbi:MAG: tetratricopeptide repeat protein [Pseudomonadota bacterium]